MIFNFFKKNLPAVMLLIALGLALICKVKLKEMEKEVDDLAKAIKTLQAFELDHKLYICEETN